MPFRNDCEVRLSGSPWRRVNLDSALYVKRALMTCRELWSSRCAGSLCQMCRQSLSSDSGACPQITGRPEGRPGERGWQLAGPEGVSVGEFVWVSRDALREPLAASRDAHAEHAHPHAHGMNWGGSSSSGQVIVP